MSVANLFCILFGIFLNLLSLKTFYRRKNSYPDIKAILDFGFDIDKVSSLKVFVSDWKASISRMNHDFTFALLRSKENQTL